MTADTFVKLLAFIAIGNALVFLMWGQALPENNFNTTPIGQQYTAETDPSGGGVLETAQDLVTNTVACTFGALSGGIVTYALGQGLVCDAVEKVFAETVGNTAIGNVAITVTEGLGTFIALTISLLSFNVPGAPTWVRFTIGTVLTGGVFFILLQTIRGTG